MLLQKRFLGNHKGFRAGWIILTVTVLGCSIGLLTLVLTAFADEGVNSEQALLCIVTSPKVLLWNLLFPVLLMWSLYLLTKRAWIGFLFSAIPVIGIAVINYYKIRLRSDPLRAVDMTLASEAANIVKRYTLDFTPVIGFTISFLFVGFLFALLFIPRHSLGLKEHFLTAFSTLAILAVLIPACYWSERIYNSVPFNSEIFNPWSDADVYVSHGCIHAFLHSTRKLYSSRTQGVTVLSPLSGKCLNLVYFPIFKIVNETDSDVQYLFFGLDSRGVGIYPPPLFV